MRLQAGGMLLTALLLNGCSNNSYQDAAEFVAAVKQEVNAKIVPLPEIQEYKSVEYDVSAMRNPFQPSPEFLANTEADKVAVATTDGVVAQSRPDIDRPKELLENYSLDSINMVGAIRKGTTVWAIVKDKTGVIHRVSIGSYLGENSGCIEKITEKSIEVKEIVADGQGGWSERVTALNIVK